MNTYIFGAKATAVGLYKALSVINPNTHVDGFLVSQMGNNQKNIFGCSVRLLDDVARNMSDKEKYEAVIYVAVPELIHTDVRALIVEKGFRNLIMIDSRCEANIMEKYFACKTSFRSVHNLPMKSIEPPKITIYVASFYKDKPLEHPPKRAAYAKKLYLGCYQARKQRINIPKWVDCFDDTGDNISFKNPNYCEMTAYYWIWKNKLSTDDEYIGVYHYRRILDINDADLMRMKLNDVDVILPFPMIHYPNSLIHHTWYISEDDWATMKKALEEIYPVYASAIDDVFSQKFFYNYNMMIAKKNVFAEYCSWLFPLLNYIEENSNPRASERNDRYIGYISEQLMSLFFLCRKDDFKIYHTGRLLYT